MNSYPVWNSTPGGEGPPQSLRWGDREFWVVPKPAGHGDGQSREQRSQLESYESCPHEPFKYDKLPKSKKRIRLLQLQSGTADGPEIHCSLIEADYDNEFHIPTEFTESRRKEEEEKERAWNDMTEEQQDEAEKDELKRKQDAYNDKRNKRMLEEERIKKMSKEEKHRYDLEKEAQEQAKEEQEEIARAKLLDEISAQEIPYEALSWHWGTGPEKFAVTITHNKKKYKKAVRKELGLALKYLRLASEPRILWVDSICIDQSDDNERNQQVQMMSRIYTRAKEVCVWLGEDTDESKMAIDFINKEIMHLNNFDTLCSDKRYSDKWRALMGLMQREWFSRRWVVQEIALASKARLWCGPDSISWKALAVAVELFVEVETATHRLSEIMKKDEKFLHIPGWFDHVSELGASLLVQATGRVFRAQRTPLHETTPDDSKEVQELRKQAILRERTIDPLDRRSLLSLEYLVSTLFIFKATEARDTVYSLLGIARDATPFARSSFRDGDPSLLMLSVMREFLEEQPFVVDYARPYSDVCRDYVEFTIRRKYKWDPVQALDVLCRPWALDPPSAKSIRLANKDEKGEKEKRPRVLLSKLPRDKMWTRTVRSIVREEGDPSPPSDTATARGSGDEQNSSSDEGGNSGGPTLPPEDPARYRLKRKYKKGDTGVTTKDTRDLVDYWKETKALKEIRDFGDEHANWRQHPPGWENVLWYFPEKGRRGGNTKDTEKTYPDSKADLDRLPSWVALASHAPFTLYPHTGMGNKAGRSNADPLVGQPQDGHRNYSAAQTNPVDLDEGTLKFRKRQKCNHYSLYVRGFELDTVDIVLDASQSGNIPKSWLDLGGWDPGSGNAYNNDPPDNLWRTLVADRGPDNRNPPYYYATACKESVQRGGIASGSVNTSDLINNHRNSIVAEFCRRVQAVIWSRHLFMTKRGKLGLGHSVQKGDKICILYGCTVPVIVREVSKGTSDDDSSINMNTATNSSTASFAGTSYATGRQPGSKKTREEIIKEEEFDDAVEALRSCVRDLEANLERKSRYERRKKELGENYETDIRDAIVKARDEAIEQLERELGLDTADSDGDDDQDGDGGEPTAPPPPGTGSSSQLPPDQTGTDSETDRDGNTTLPPPPPTRPPTTSGTNPPHPNKLRRLGTVLSVTTTLGGGTAPPPTGSRPSGGTWGKLSKLAEIVQSDLDDTVRNNNIKALAKMSGASRQPIKRYPEAPVANLGVYYEFKGEAYVHGMMDGEALRVKLYEGLADVLFELR